MTPVAVLTEYVPPTTDTVVWLQLGGVCTGDVPQRRTEVASSGTRESP